MKVFLTGASGYIGNAVGKALVQSGHSVTGFVRSENAKKTVEAAGMTSLLGNLNQLGEFEQQVLEHDAFINCAADMSDYAVSDAKVVEFISSLAKKKPTMAAIYTSGCLVLGNTGRAAKLTEESKFEVPEGLKWRHGHENVVCAASSKYAVIRPVFVWGNSGSHGATWAKPMLESKTVRIIGEGGAFPWIHVDDLGRLYVAVTEAIVKHDNKGGVYHGTDGHPSHSTAEMQKAFGRLLGADKVVNVTLEEARKFMGPFADFLQFQQGHLSADKAKSLGWAPKHADPMKELEEWAKANCGDRLKEWAPVRGLQAAANKE